MGRACAFEGEGEEDKGPVGGGGGGGCDGDFCGAWDAGGFGGLGDGKGLCELRRNGVRDSWGEIGRAFLMFGCLAAA